MKVRQLERTHLRRSTRVPIQVRIEVQATGMVCDGETVIVNLHGALLRTSRQLEVQDRITVRVPITGKSAAGRVVFVDPGYPLHFGVALDQPQNIWGISLPPADWEARASDG